MSTAIRRSGLSPADLPWSDRAGHFSPLHAAAFTIAILPALLLAFDALTVVVHPSNPLRSITTAQLRRIWEPDAQGRIPDFLPAHLGKILAADFHLNPCAQAG